jgi:nucleoside 2-deoxyribosyltransferase
MSITPKIYVACGLTSAPPEFIHFILQLKERLRFKYQILDFLSNPLDMNVDKQSLEYCQKIYHWDRDQIINCDLVLAITDYASTGMGLEMGLAVHYNKPILQGCRPNQILGRMNRGITDTVNHCFEYESIDDIVEQVDKFFDTN